MEKIKKLPDKRKKWLPFFLLGCLVIIFAVAVLFQYYQGQKIYRVQEKINYKTAKAIKEASVAAVVRTFNAGKTTIATPAAVKITMPNNSGRSVQVPILTYHYIGLNPNPADKARDNLSVAPDKFDAQMGQLAKDGFTPITFDTMYAALKGQVSLPHRPIILTFDDGYIDFYTTAFPILRKYGFHAVSFIPTGLMNQGYYMSWTQIKEIEGSGLVSFECHSVNHLNLASLNHDQLIYQLSQCKKTLESELGKPVNFMAYPYGVSNETVWNATKAAGFLGSVGTYYGTTESEGNIYDMPRIKVAGGWSNEEFAKRF